MKITLITVFLAALVGANKPPPPVVGPYEPPPATKASFDMMRARDLLDKSIKTFKKEGPDAVKQPECIDVPSGYFITCITYPEKATDSTWLVSPVVPSGTKLTDFVGEPNEDTVFAATDVIRDGLSKCRGPDDYVLITYEWDNDLLNDAAGEVLKTSLFQVFDYGKESIYCLVQVGEEEI